MTVQVDFRIALRALIRRPTLVVVVIGTLALGVGFNTIIYSFIDATLLRPLDVPSPERLLAVSRSTPTNSGTRALTYDAFEYLESRLRLLSGVAAVTSIRITCEVEDVARAATVAFATDTYFDVLEVDAALGRLFHTNPGSTLNMEPVAVLSWDLWQQDFGGRAEAVGDSIRINGAELTVVGVAPQTFRGTRLGTVVDVWVPLDLIPVVHPPLLARGNGINRELALFRVFGRLSAGVDASAGSADIVRVLSQYEASEPRSVDDRTAYQAVPLTQDALGSEDRSRSWRFATLLLIIGATALLIACMNIANLLVVRAAEREKELEIRAALGGTIARITRQLFAESLLLAGFGGVVGIAVAAVGTRLLSTLALPGHLEPRALGLGITSRTLLFAFSVAMATSLLFGLAPAARVHRKQFHRLLGGYDDTLKPVARHRALLASQIGLSVALIVGSALMIRSFRAGLTADLGFSPNSVAAASYETPPANTTAENVMAIESVVRQLAEGPGILSAAAATHVPLAPTPRKAVASGPSLWGAYEPDPVLLEGGEPEQDVAMMGMNRVTDEYFETLGIPVLEGRSFSRDDVADAEKVIVLNETAARTLFPGGQPLGKKVHARWMHFAPFWFTYTVVGVVQDSKYRTLEEEAAPFIFVPIRQEDIAGETITFLTRSSSGRDAIAFVEQTAADVAPEFQLANGRGFQPRLVSDQVRALLAPQEFALMLLTGFSVLTLAVAGVGIYGAVAYAVSQRTAEIGVRIALGARSAAIIRLVLSWVGTAVVVGVIGGMAGAILLGQLLQSLLYGVGPADPLSFLGGITVMSVVALLAALVPCRRATRISPTAAIRSAQ